MAHKNSILREILKKMVLRVIPCFSLLLVMACSNGFISYRMVNKDNTNTENLEKTKNGMTKTEVLTLMGPADRSEKFERQGVDLEILYYLTSGSYSPDRGWQNIHSTPIVFEGGLLKGWGKYYDEQRLGSPRISQDQ
jgi:hypothetical protein